ncbi:MAG TPA: hypothetical protein VK815_07320 [Candidatus Acidoferrales bacterium]|jgi:hypothetical protein|nr:hypothetical protein [Candidatus Acidoferrales bacterium]
MNDRQPFFGPGKLGLVLGAVFLGTLTGCVGYVDRGEGYAVSSPAVIEDDYVYYPNYEIYYSSSRHQYAYRDGRNWVSRPAPRGVSADVLLASPSVRMNFHDSPAQHHAAVVKQYPKNWSPPAQKQDKKENRKDDQKDDHGK